jgi:hypothetical protein
MMLSLATDQLRNEWSEQLLVSFNSNVQSTRSSMCKMMMRAFCNSGYAFEVHECNNL